MRVFASPLRRPERRFLGLTLVFAALLTAGSAVAQNSDQQADEQEGPPRFEDSVSVTATLSPRAVDETPGTVSVIGSAEIAQRLAENLVDLVRYEPGVYIESDVTRVGLNGFNIRGIGGNRVLTQVDGVETSEQFDFGLFHVHQYALDLDTLDSAEIVRSSSSSLYGSDALGGVVSLFTKDPVDYLSGQPFHVAGKALFDGRSRETGGNGVLAGGNGRVQGSLFASVGRGSELGNQGDIETRDQTRTAPNLQDRQSLQALGKLTFRVADGNILRGTVEVTDTEIETQAFSSWGMIALGPTVTNVSDVVATDTMRRQRYSVDQDLANRSGWGQWSWSLYMSNNDTSQLVTERRVTVAFGPPVVGTRRGTLDYEQGTIGGTVRGQRLIGSGDMSAMLSFGGSYKRDTFDMVRDRTDINVATGASIPTRLLFPSKYFPRSEVSETGAYVQAELQLRPVTVVPGLRYDNFSLDADETDHVYIDNQNPAASDFEASVVSSRIGASAAVTDALTVHAQYAGGFRSPPYSAVNTGFTNLLGGYTTLPNTELEAETSDNVEVGLRATLPRGSFGVTGFANRFDDFIELTDAGFNPRTLLLEFQNQNLSEVSITGVEFRAQAFIGDEVVINASFAAIDGQETSGDTDVPLESIAPNQGAIGVLYAPVAAPFGTEVNVRFAGAKAAEDVVEGGFAPDGYGVLDVTGWFDIADDITLRAGVLNLTNTTYHEWWNVRGRQADDPAIDRYTSPGISGIVSLSYGW